MNTDNTLVIALIALFGWTAVADIPDRKVVTITMPVSTYVQAIEAARMEAALETADALEPEPCPAPNWRDMFRDTPPERKPAPPTK